MSKDVHTEHCCKNCGCKYGDDHYYQSEDGKEYCLCSVVSGDKEQSFKCGETSVCYWHDEY